MTPEQKRVYLAQYIELLIFCGYDITNVVGRPLSYFDFEKIKLQISLRQIEKSLING